MGEIVWLASYPKSGNTWVRVFLTNYLRDGSEPADINDLDGAPIASDRNRFDELSGVESSDLTADEVARYRAAVYRAFAAETEGLLFVKVHDAHRDPDCSEELFPAEVTRHVVYIIRNPLDLTVSLAHHFGISIDETLDRV